MIEAHKEGVNALDNGDVIFAAKKFKEAELLFPQSDWAPKSALMSAYAYWTLTGRAADADNAPARG